MTLLLLYPLFKHSSILVLTVSIMREKEKTFLLWWTFYLLNVLSGKTTERRATSAKKKKNIAKVLRPSEKESNLTLLGMMQIFHLISLQSKNQLFLILGTD